MKRRKRTILVLYSILLTAFSVYFLLDTFVIERVYSVEITPGEVQDYGSASSGSGPEDGDAQKNDGTGNGVQSADGTADAGTQTTDIGSEQPGTETVSITEESSGEGAAAENAGEGSAPAEPAITENSYYDGNISIVITEYRENGTDIYVADIRLSSADYLKTALAKGVYGRNVTAKTSEIARSSGAILAVNGDYYGSQQTGYVIRGGVLYRGTAVKGRQDLVIYSDGSMEVVSESDISAEELLAKGAEEVLSFGPGLIEDGKITVSRNYEVARAMVSNPRTAIGVIDELHYVFVVSDGRTTRSEGLSVYELAVFMQSLGVRTAYNLDGGGSSTMYFNGSVINDPVGGGRGQSERSVSDIVYIGY